MIALNQHLFLLLNASAGAAPILVDVAKLLANDVVYFIPLVLICLWTWPGRPSVRGGALATSLMAALALLANQIVGQFWYEPRPFMIGLGRTLLDHAPENSFPSDHTTFIVSVGIGLLATGSAKRLGPIIIVMGILVGWARVYLGLHFPIDIFTSVLIAALFGTSAVHVMTAIDAWIVPIAEEIYDRVLDTIRLPERLFPRRQRYR